MTAEQAAEYLRRFTLHGGLRTWGAQLRVYAFKHAVVVRIEMHVQDRDCDYERIPITFEQRLGCTMLPELGEDFLQHWMRCALRALVDHELSESVKFDGKRVREVHELPKFLGIEVRPK